MYDMVPFNIFPFVVHLVLFFKVKNLLTLLWIMMTMMMMILMIKYARNLSWCSRDEQKPIAVLVR